MTKEQIRNAIFAMTERNHLGLTEVLGAVLYIELTTNLSPDDHEALYRRIAKLFNRNEFKRLSQKH